MNFIDRLRAPFAFGRSQSRRDALTSCVVALVLTACSASAALAFAMLPQAGEGQAVLMEDAVPTGSWAIEWSPTVRPPAVEQRQQVRSLRLVAAGTAGLLSALCSLVMLGLWGQRLRARRSEHFVHWAVGAGPSQQDARLIGEAGAWWLGAGCASVLAAVAVAAAVRHTFPGTATLAPDLKAALIVLTGGAAAVLRWERRAASRPLGSARFDVHDLLGSPVPIAAVGVAVLSGVGLLAVHAPGSGRAAEPGAVVVGTSLSGLAEDDRRRSIVRLTEDLTSPATRPVGVASAGAARGVGHAEGVSTECGRCFEGLMPMPIKYVRAEVHAVSQDTFPHLGLRVIRGRDFDDRADVGPPSVAIVSEALANRHFERGQALGKRVRIGNGDWLTVVGVAQDALDVRSPFEYAVYLPLTQALPSEIEVLSVGTEPSADALTEAAERGAIVSLPRTRAEVFAVHRWFRSLLMALGALAMVVVGAGLWVAAANEAWSTRFEMGLRRAVGAAGRDLYRYGAAFLARRLAAAVCVGLWLSLFLAAGLKSAYGAIPPIDGIAVAPALAWVLLIYLLGSLPVFARVIRSPLMRNLRAAD